MGKISKAVLLLAKIKRKLKKQKELSTAEKALLAYFGDVNKFSKRKQLKLTG